MSSFSQQMALSLVKILTWVCDWDPAPEPDVVNRLADLGAALKRSSDALKQAEKNVETNITAG